jgi:hypothetical protein
MNTEKFVKLLKSIVKEAVREELQNVLLSEQATKKINMMDQVNTRKSYVKQQKPVQKQTYVNNPVLNDILNETAAAGAYISPDATEEWPSMDFSMGSVMAHNMGQGMGMPKQINATPAGVSLNQLDDTLKDVFTKDYSALMKAIDKKKGM